ncbi:MAG: ANTAR domain-containing protein [Clostridiales bacterium]|nr:ANTAR domain-containing protein [Clostridiales bacterium]
MRGIILACPDGRVASQLARTLSQASHEVLFVCSTGNAVLRAADQSAGAVVICPLILPDMPANDLAAKLPYSYDVIALSGTPVQSASSNFTVLKLPLNRAVFLETVSALCASGSFVRPRGIGASPVIEQAKLKLIRERGFSETGAHRYLQKMSMERGWKKTETAQKLLDGEF